MTTTQSSKRSDFSTQHVCNISCTVMLNYLLSCDIQILVVTWFGMSERLHWSEVVT